MMRPNTLSESTSGGEPDLDANVALSELDKGLRSGKTGEQCEAIVRFPALFERYPFPILINSAFLKLADVFRNASNFLRLWILRVCQQTDQHLEKIFNVDEFVRLIFSVMHSNDPIARALTLRTLGSMAGLIPERKQVHHSIRIALDSHDRIEVRAAVYAASCFAQRSKTFGTTMCTKIASMVQSLSTPIDLKLRLITIFQYMHHDVTIAAMVRKLCQELLHSHPAEEFVTTTLHTLTQLAAFTISDLEEQVSFLLEHLDEDRINVKISILKDLKFLGDKGGHLWESGQISTLIHTLFCKKPDDMDFDMENVKITLLTLDVINSITSSSAVETFIYSPDSSLWLLVGNCMNSDDLDIALKSIEIATSLAVNWRQEGNSKSKSSIDLVEMATNGVEAVFKKLCAHTIISVRDNNGPVKEKLSCDIEKCLSYGVMLCKAQPSKCGWFTDVVLEMVNCSDFADESRNKICEALAAVGSMDQQTVQRIMPDIVGILKKWNRPKTESTVAVLVAIIFQAHQGYELSSDTNQVIYATLQKSNLWLAYRVARNALRYGQPHIAIYALKDMFDKVSLESFHYWLSALYDIARAENIVANSSDTILRRLNEATNIYTQALTKLKASISPTATLQFQIEYLRIRAEVLYAFKEFIALCMMAHLMDPSSVASNAAVAARDEMLKYGRVVTQMRKCIRDFQNISEMYVRLYQAAFDADSDTLQNIQIQQQMCLLFARAIEKQSYSKDHPSYSEDDQAYSFCDEISYVQASNSWLLIHSCRRAVEMLTKLKGVPNCPLTDEHINALKDVACILVETPVAFPRFFFQTLQMTRVKIAVSPPPLGPGESVLVTPGNDLALKVEGVIQQTGFQGLETQQKFRKPKAIRITVISTPSQTQPRPLELGKQSNADSITLVKDVVPHRDFFTSQFLLSVSNNGVTNVTVDTSLVDYENRVWMTGPRAVLAVAVRVDDQSGGGSKNTNSPLPAPGPSRQLSMVGNNLNAGGNSLPRF